MEQDFAKRLERLRSLVRERRVDTPSAAAEATSDDPTADCGDSDAPDGHAAWEPLQALELQAVATSAGTAYRRETVYPLPCQHGDCPLDLLLGTGETAWMALGGHRPAGTPFSVPLSECAFLDVETTGLAGGTGTVAFLIGLALVSHDAVTVRQYFLPDFGDEAALLTAVNEDLSGRRTLITYNGKTFDWPLLETRFIMNRLRPAIRSPQHIDLLHAARRIWQDHLADRRLGTVEAAIIGHERDDDIPGALIPTLYFAYQRSGDARPLRPVMTHNEHDLVSLVALLGLIGEAIATPLASRLRHAAEFHGLGRWCVDLGFTETGLLCLERAQRSELPTGNRERILRDLASLYKRLRQRASAVDVWQSLVTDGALSAQPYIELAKHYEHSERDYAAALALTEQALGLAGLAGGMASARERDSLLHRRQRLLRRLKRVN